MSFEEYLDFLDDYWSIFKLPDKKKKPKVYKDVKI